MKQVTFIHHSSFLVELDTVSLLFDYVPAGNYADYTFHGQRPHINPDKPLLVFASHHHKDHYDLSVLDFLKENPNTYFIFAKDVRLGNRYLIKNGYDPKIKERITMVSARSDYEVCGVKIETLRSTDAGVAFIVNVGGELIFHAGDLHWWNIGESELYGNKFGKEFKTEIKLMKDKVVDLAFVVLDPRLGDGTAYGLEAFVNTVPCNHVFPMHMWQKFDIIEEAKKRPAIINFADKIVDIDRENIIFDIED